MPRLTSPRQSLSPRGAITSRSKGTWSVLLFLATILNLAIQFIGNSRSHQDNCAVTSTGGGGGVTSNLQGFKTGLGAGVGASSLRTSNGYVQDNTRTVTSANRDAREPPATPTKPQEDPCETEYKRLTSNATAGLTPEDLKRSWTHVGSRQRLAKLGRKLKQNEEPITAVVTGGSISLGHGVVDGLRYSGRLETWLNAKYPIKKPAEKHRVLNKGSHGADICAMAKRLTLLMEDLPPQVDLIVLEFAVNDYQGQDHQTMIEFKMDVFFDGFDNIAMCTETVLHRLLYKYPNAAIVFLEMRTAIMARKTASLLHMGAAQHYQVPVLSYDQALFPDYQYLLQKLKPFNYTTAKGDTVLPYPHGCHPCIHDHITEGFRKKGCASVCRIQQFSPVDAPKDCKNLPEGREHCNVPFFAHDEVHPSGIGHKIASDLIIDAIASTAQDVCHGEKFTLDPVTPSTGWMVSDPDRLDMQHNFLMVNDTYEIFVKKRKLQASSHTEGFTYYEDRFGRWGWIATNPAGAESVQFDINFPVQEGQCYVPYLSVLKSYENMGAFTITVLDLNTQQQTSMDVDSLWQPKISVPNDIPLTEDTASPMACTGHCQVTVKTHPQGAGRGGNKVKIVTLSVRKCIR